jgi:2-oxoglutarate dehydrogenase E2 component (dihydrolipoamide succinyltransferase)
VSEEATPESTPSSVDELSPAVRRLVRQFDLDITGIHGTGPAGRIRVGDVMGLLGGRTDSGNRDVPRLLSEDDLTPPDGEEAGVEATPATPLPLPLPAAEAAPHSTVATSSVFECDVGRMLAHRKKLGSGNVDLLTTSYFVTALAAALDATPEITAGHPPRFGVWLTTASGDLRGAFLDVAALSGDAAFDERVRAVDAALRANFDADVTAANLLVHHHGESGSMLATSTPIGRGHAASVGIGRIRREFVVRVIDGVETARVATRCYLSISFFDDRVPFHRANRALADSVHILENWPE